MTQAVTAYRPILNGFAFKNSFSAEAIRSEFGVPSWLNEVLTSNPATLPFGVSLSAAYWLDDTWGLCGGMCFASLDRYFNRQPTPTDTVPPRGSSPLFRELFDRQNDAIESVGWRTILDYQVRPDEGAWYEFQHSLGHYVLTRQWPAVRAQLDDGIPAVVCLIRVGRTSPAIWNNHIVVAWAYEIDGNDVEIQVYDPNKPGESHRLGFRLNQRNSRLDATDTGTDRTLRGFIMIPYDRQERFIASPASDSLEREDLAWLETVLA